MDSIGGLDSDSIPKNERDCDLGVPRFEGPKPQTPQTTGHCH